MSQDSGDSGLTAIYGGETAKKIAFKAAIAIVGTAVSLVFATQVSEEEGDAAIQLVCLIVSIIAALCTVCIIAIQYVVETVRRTTVDLQVRRNTETCHHVPVIEGRTKRDRNDSADLCDTVSSNYIEP